MNIKIVYIIELLTLFSMFIYNIQVFKYSETIIRKKNQGISYYIVFSAFNSFLFYNVFKFNIPIVIINIFCIIILFIEFIILFEGRLLEKFFGSGNFVLHLMLLRLMVLSIFSICCKCSIYDIVQNKVLYYISIFITMIICMNFLRIFEKIINSDKVELIIKYKEQLKYSSTAVAIMNIYLVITSIVYEINIYEILILIFLLITSLMLFLAFYIVFNHSIKMGLMMEYKQKSTYLENELIKNKQNQEELQSVVFIDELTGVYNRRYATIKLNNLISNNKEFCVCFIDIDELKCVNDAFGHNKGDEYIIAISRILSGEFCDDDKVCRLGGDEFLVLTPNCDENFARKRVHKVFKKVKDECEKKKVPYNMSISYGVVYRERQSEIDAESLVELADKDMYNFKKSKKY